MLSFSLIIILENLFILEIYLIIINLYSAKQKQKISDFTTLTQKALNFALKKFHF